MQIQSVRHKGLKRLIEDDDDRGIRRDLVGRVRNVVTVLIAAADMDGVHQALRKRWVAAGIQWWSTAIPEPLGFDPVAQFRNIE